MRDDDDLDDGGRAGAVGGSDSGKVRSCESSLAGGWLGFGLVFDCDDDEEEPDCAESGCCVPDGAGLAPGFCPAEFDCGALVCDGFAPESALLPCCAHALTAAAVSINSNNLPLILLFYLRLDMDSDHAKKAKKTGRSGGD
jgi:hypothetical protein